MKTKHFLLLFLIASIPFAGNSQPFVKGDKVINVGLGIGSTLYSGVGYKTGLPPLSASLEVGVTELGPGILGVGGYFGISSYKWEDSYGGTTYGWKYSNIIIGARGNYHYIFAEKLDTYAGLMLGYNIVNSKATGTWPALFGDLSANSSTFIWSLYVGGRYYFSDSFAVMAELGYGIAWLNIGVAFKL
ncbi:MAG: hypothetical protein AMS26_17900 [Bacteroides sp. SM23_62]|nr:MAG: hypothetical protein AMS26_17900 [Bacteroides sp. SM23_62]